MPPILSLNRLRSAGLCTLAAILPACTGPRGPSEWVTGWNLGELRPRPLRVELRPESSDRVRLDGTLHAYGTWSRRDFQNRGVQERGVQERGVQEECAVRGDSVECPLPDHRDLKLLVELDASLADLRSDPDSSPTVSWTFRKLSPRLLGPRLYHDPRVHVWIDGARHELDSSGVVDGDLEFYAETRSIELPLGTFLDIGSAEEVRIRVSQLSPFNLDDASLATIRELGLGLEAAGVATERLPRAPRASRQRLDPVGAGGSIWGLLYDHDTPRHHSRVVQVSSYPGPRHAVHTLRPTAWVDLGDHPRRTQRVVRMVGNEGDARPYRPTPAEPDAWRAWKLARCAASVIEEEFGLEQSLESYVYLFPVEEKRGCRLICQTPIGRGVAFGVPTIDGQLRDEHATTLLWLMAHEYGEGLLILPYLGGDCALYRSSRRNRWVGDGIAELLGAMAHRRAIANGESLPSPGDDLQWLLEEVSRGVDLVGLSGWLTIDPPAAGEGTPLGDAGARELGEDRSPRRSSTHERSTASRHAPPPVSSKTRYLTAEYLCHRWYESARRRGHERPLSSFVHWLRGFPEGPSHGQLMAWLSQSSGLDILRAERGVDIQSVLSYHLNKWRELGWSIPWQLRSLHSY